MKGDTYIYDDFYKEFVRSKGFESEKNIKWIGNRRPSFDPFKYCQEGESILMKSAQCGMTNIRFKSFVGLMRIMVCDFEQMTEEVEC